MMMTTLDQNTTLLAVLSDADAQEIHTTTFAWYAVGLGLLLFLASVAGRALVSQHGNLFPAEVQLYTACHFVTGLVGLTLMVVGPIAMKGHDPRARLLLEAELDAVMLTAWGREARSLLRSRCARRTGGLCVGDVMELVALQRRRGSPLLTSQLPPYQVKQPA